MLYFATTTLTQGPYELVATPMLGLSLDSQKCFSTSIVVLLHWKKWYSENISSATGFSILSSPLPK